MKSLDNLLLGKETRITLKGVSCKGFLKIYILLVFKERKKIDGFDVFLGG